MPLYYINQKYLNNLENIMNIVNHVCFLHPMNMLCHNLNLGLATKARACKVAGQERSLGVIFHAPRSAKECEGMNPHTPK
jgi:hypothetical protein